MKIRFGFITALALLFCCLAAAGQRDSYKADILNVCKSFLSSRNYSLEVQYQLYLDDNLTTPFQERRVQMLRSGENFYARQEQTVEMLDFGQYEIVLDHRAKMMAVLVRQKTENYNQRRNTLINELKVELDSLLNYTTSVKKLEEDDRYVTYECRYRPQDAFARVVLEIDKKGGFYKSITTTFKKPTVVPELENTEHHLTLTVNYLGLNRQPVVTDGLFDVDSYLEMKGSEIVAPAGRFRSYTLF